MHGLLILSIKVQKYQREFLWMTSFMLHLTECYIQCNSILETHFMPIPEADPRAVHWCSCTSKILLKFSNTDQKRIKQVFSEWDMKLLKFRCFSKFTKKNILSESKILWSGHFKITDPKISRKFDWDKWN